MGCPQGTVDTKSLTLKNCFFVKILASIIEHLVCPKQSDYILYVDYVIPSSQQPNKAGTIIISNLQLRKLPKGTCPSFHSGDSRS